MNEIKAFDEVEQLTIQANAFKQQAEAMIVETSEHVMAATNLLGFITTSKKKFEERRMFFIKPLNDQVKAINDAFKAIVTPLDGATVILKNKVLDCQREQEKKRQEELAKQYEAGEVTAQAPEMVKGDLGKAFTKKVWTFEVVDETKIPRLYFTLDEKKIREAIRAGVREIPGVRIFQDEQLTVSGRRG